MIRNFTDFVFLMGAICLLFITTVTAPAIGIQQVSTYSTLIIVTYSFFFFIRNPYIFSLRINKYVKYYSFVVFIIAIKYVLQNELTLGIYFLKEWLTPVIILIYFENVHNNRKVILKRLLIIFFIIECFLGIYERFTTTFVFESYQMLDLSEYVYQYTENTNIEFRAQSLLGNPLTNAHLICIMLGIILNSTFKIELKIFLLITGILGIVSFNARVATICIFIVSLLYYMSIRKILKQKNIEYLKFIFLSAIILITYLMLNSSLGGRLIYQEKLIDGSALERVRAFTIFSSIFKNNDLMLGVPGISSNMLTENGYLNLMIMHGIPFSILLVITQFLLIRSRLHYLNKRANWIFYISFFIVGFSNNNLARADSFLMFCIWISTFELMRQKIIIEKSESRNTYFEIKKR